MEPSPLHCADSDKGQAVYRHSFLRLHTVFLLPSDRKGAPLEPVAIRLLLSRNLPAPSAVRAP